MNLWHLVMREVRVNANGVWSSSKYWKIRLQGGDLEVNVVMGGDIQIGKVGSLILYYWRR